VDITRKLGSSRWNERPEQSSGKEPIGGMKTALLFPGQGSQYVGMGKFLWEAIPEVRRLYQTAADLLGFDAERLCFQGPKERLNTTLYTQPILFTVSVAVLRAFEQEVALPADFVAGHSLGEYAALVAAGCLAFEDGLQLVKQRATFMQESVPDGTGGMVAVMGLGAEQLKGICRDCANGQVLVLANYNAPNQIVISGEEGPLRRAMAMARENKAKTVRLPVSAPFHSPLMNRASERLERVVDDVDFKDPRLPWISNVTASPTTIAVDCRRLLPLQVRSPVLWEASIRRMQQSGVTRFIELGPQKVLKGLCKRIDPSILCQAAETLEELKALK
jgi:[acyl-carrier-protein] S-malonyltransferase